MSDPERAAWEADELLDEEIEGAFPRREEEDAEPTEPGPAGEDAPAPPTSPLAPGRVLGDYQLVELVGEGGMGQVWRAAQRSLGGREVALKFVRPDRVSSRQLEYFAREARAGGRLSHPGIVRVYATGRDEGLEWIAMEYVEGHRNLRDRLDATARLAELPADYDRGVAHLAASLADALQTAHDAGVIHRDVKPQNVLVTPEGAPKVGDFGLARIVDEASLSRSGELAGTYYYMSPEQVAAKRMGIDHRTDVFSLGVVMYELLALRRPFEGDTSHQVATQIMTREPPDPRTIRSRVPAELVVITGKAMEKDPARRYPSMAELAADLRRYLADEPIVAQPPGAWQRAIKWAKRHTTLSVAGAVAAAALVAISSLLWANLLANRELRETVVERDGAITSLEDRSAELGAANQALAEKTRAAEEAAAAEKARADEVLRLSALQRLEDLVAEAAGFVPPTPERIPAYLDWLGRAEALVADLPLHRATREALRASALPPDEHSTADDPASSPELAGLEREIESKRRALRRRRSGETLALTMEIPPGTFLLEPGTGDEFIRRYASPDRREFGLEEPALAALRCSLQLTDDHEVTANLHMGMGWAYHALGDDQQALQAGYMALEALADAPPRLEDRYMSKLSELEEATEIASSPAGLRAAETELAALEAKRSELLRNLEERRGPPYAADHEEEHWWDTQLTKLIDGLEQLRAGLLAPEAISTEHGWSVPKRLAFARRLEAGLASDADHARAWDEALPAIRAAYPGLALEPQMGLVPVGPDPDSGLWEFAHLMTGAVPVRDSDGVLSFEGESAVVLVLLPGGRFWMGAQSVDPEGPNFDLEATASEVPLLEVELSPFFISKYEMTQGQWTRLTGGNPSQYPDDPANPLEQVSWLDCRRWLPQAGLDLPSEAQWEYAARAGSDSPWPTGATRETLQRGANVWDLSTIGNTTSTQEPPEPWDDGASLMTTVGSYAPNPFGLHDVAGNVQEWCLDGYHGDYLHVLLEALSAGLVRDPVGSFAGTVPRIVRGGSYGHKSWGARSAYRNRFAPTFTDNSLGVRPVRAIDGR